MILLLLVLFIICAIGLTHLWFSRGGISLNSAGDFFMLAWLYYGFSIPIDMLLGCEPSVFQNMPSFSEPQMQGPVLLGLLLYLFCGLAFIGAYHFGQRNTLEGQTESKSIYLPPLWFMIALHFASLALFREDYFHASRQARSTVHLSSALDKLPYIMLIVIRAADVLFILYSKHTRSILVVAACGAALGVIAGDRSDIMVIGVSLLLRFRLTFPRWKFAGMAAGTLLILAVWKLLYAYSIDYLLFGTPHQQLSFDRPWSLSGIDSYPSFMILTSYLQDPCPYWCGKTYIVDPLLMTPPSDFRDASTMTLGQRYAWEYFPKLASKGMGTGFSAIAESWLNFGLLGPALLGIFWGRLARRVDKRTSLIALFIVTIMICRLFRSDTASLWKSWGVLFGGSIYSIYFVLGTLDTLRKKGVQSRGELSIKLNT